MAKGNLAKKNVINKLASAFGADYIGEYNGKYYVWAQDEGEKVQIALSLTCPKAQVGITTPITNGGFDFSGENEVIAPADFQPAEITQEEQDNIAELMARLGL